MKFIFTLTLLLSVISANAVYKVRIANDTLTPTYNDQIFVDLNLYVLVSGQTLNFKAYVQNPGYPDRISPSTVIYFEILNHQYQIVHTWKSNINSGLSFGTTSIPDTISGGLYILRAFTNWMRNFGTEGFFVTPVILTHLSDHKLENVSYPSSISGLLNLVSDADTISSNEYNKISNCTGTEIVSIKSVNQTFKSNSKIKFDLSANIPETDLLNLSVSVFENNSIEKLIKNDGITGCFNSNKPLISIDQVNGTSKILYPLELVGSYLTGTLYNDSTKQPVTNTPIYLSKIDSTVQFKYDETTDEGKFGFLINRNYDNHPLILQAPQVESNFIKWTIDSKWDNRNKVSATQNFRLSKTEEDELDDMRKIELTKRLFERGSYNEDVIHEFNGQSFYYVPDYIVKPSDYEDLDNFADISENILPLVRFKQNRKGYSFYMILSEMEKASGYTPGLFLNGLPFFNFEYVSPLNSKDINRIEVCTHPIMYGNLTYYGIVSVFTHSDELKRITFGNPMYKVDNFLTDSRLSDRNLFINRQTLFFTPCIYWNPDITLQGNETKTIEFDTPNIRMEYLLRINGITKNGTPFSKTISFKIED